MPQGSVLGPILFLVYINDLEEGVTGNILKFADDTKLFTKTKEIGDKQNLQDDIDKLVKWSEKWQMLFNFGKCKCLHIGPGNTRMNYEMGGTILSTTVKEKDLGVTMNANMKVSEQCRIAASKGNQQTRGDSTFNDSDSDSDSSTPFRFRFRLRFQSSWLRFRLQHYFYERFRFRLRFRFRFNSDSSTPYILIVTPELYKF